MMSRFCCAASWKSKAKQNACMKIACGFCCKEGMEIHAKVMSREQQPTDSRARLKCVHLNFRKSEKCNYNKP